MKTIPDPTATSADAQVPRSPSSSVSYDLLVRLFGRGEGIVCDANRVSESGCSRELDLHGTRVHLAMLRRSDNGSMAILDPSGLVVRWYGGAGDGERRGSTVLGRHVAQFYGPSDVANGLLQRHLGAATAHGRSTQHGWRVSARGRRFWGVTDIRTILRHDGTLLGFVHVIRPDSDSSEPVSAHFAHGRTHAPAYARAAAGA